MKLFAMVPLQMLASLAAGDWLIVPGQRIGNLPIGAKSGPLLAKLGKPSNSDAAMGKAWTTWTGKSGNRVDVYTSSNQPEAPTIQLVRVTSPSFKTKNGLGPGAPAAKFQAAYPTCTRIAAYQSQGKRIIAFDSNRGIGYESTKGIVTAVYIHRPGQTFQSYLSMFGYLAN